MYSGCPCGGMAAVEVVVVVVAIIDYQLKTI